MQNSGVITYKGSDGQDHYGGVLLKNGAVTATDGSADNYTKSGNTIKIGGVDSYWNGGRFDMYAQGSNGEYGSTGGTGSYGTVTDSNGNTYNMDTNGEWLLGGYNPETNTFEQGLFKDAFNASGSPKWTDANFDQELFKVAPELQNNPQAYQIAKDWYFSNSSVKATRDYAVGRAEATKEQNDANDAEAKFYEEHPGYAPNYGAGEKGVTPSELEKLYAQDEAANSSKYAFEGYPKDSKEARNNGATYAYGATSTSPSSSSTSPNSSSTYNNSNLTAAISNQSSDKSLTPSSYVKNPFYMQGGNPNGLIKPYIPVYDYSRVNDNTYA